MPALGKPLSSHLRNLLIKLYNLFGFTGVVGALPEAFFSNLFRRTSINN